MAPAPPPRRASPTARRRRQVRWARRLRRLGLAWQNVLELARAGRLSAPRGAAFEVVAEDPIARLRRYARAPDAPPIAAPLLLVPPLMVAAEIYDIAPDISAIGSLQRAGVDVWLIDFGAPEHAPGGMARTLDDHVRAVAGAVDRVRAATGHAVHLAGYSQGGMFAYQAAALRRSAGIASVITMGSPVDLHRTVQLGEQTTERMVAGLRAAIAWPLARIEGLPGIFTSTGFKLLSARKEVAQLVDFVRNLHDREALERREARRIFLGGEGFVAWPGPALRKFIDDVIVGNRMQSGGFVIDGHAVSLADLECPILYFVGTRDELGRPAAVRGIRRAAPRARGVYEVLVEAGHFGLVVGSAALAVTWPAVVAWLRWRAGTGPLPAGAREAGGADARATAAAPPAAPGDPSDDSPDDPGVGEDRGAAGRDLQLARDVVETTARAALEQLGTWAEDLGAYVDHARWQLPRLARLRNLQDDSLISLGRSLADQARRIPDRTFFLFRGRAFTYADASRRVDAVVHGLIASGIAPRQRVGVMMRSRPSHLTATAALSRLGAVAVLLSPDTPAAALPQALALGAAEAAAAEASGAPTLDALIVDPESAAIAADALVGSGVRLLALGGAGEVPWAPDQPRVVPPGVIDLEAIDPARVELPPWYRADPGRARDLAMVFVSASAHEPLRATQITNRRWAVSALGAAAAAMLTARDTVYCCLPLHHPSGALVATGSALVSGARLALARRFDPALLWDEVRRYGATVVYYAGELCRRLVDAPPHRGEREHPVRLFAGSGLRRGVWRALVDRFGPVGVLELYASTEAAAVLANARGQKVGSVGRPLPGSPELMLAAWDFAARRFERTGAGHVVPAPLGEPGVLLARLPARGPAPAHLPAERLLRGALAPGDLWFVTGDLLEVDPDGDHFFVGRLAHIIDTRRGPVAPARIEDALYQVAGVALCVALAHDDPDHPGAQVPVAAVELRPGAALDLAALAAAVAALPEAARPHRVRVVAAIPLSDGYRAIRPAALEVGDGPAVYEWDALGRSFRATAPAP